MSTVLMRLEAAQSDDRVRLKDGLREPETVHPVAARRVDLRPSVLRHFVEDQAFEPEFLGEREDTLLLEYLAGLYGAAPVSENDPLRVLPSDDLDSRPYRIDVGRSRRWICRVEVGLDQNAFVSEIGHAQCAHDFLRAAGPVRIERHENPGFRHI